MNTWDLLLDEAKELLASTGRRSAVIKEMVVCTKCNDYSYCEPAHIGHCSVCGAPMRLATPEEKCRACQNPHLESIRHSCGKPTPSETVVRWKITFYDGEYNAELYVHAMNVVPHEDHGDVVADGVRIEIMGGYKNIIKETGEVK